MEKSIFLREYEILIELLIEDRLRTGLTQEDVAKRLGATQSWVSKCERRERRIDVVETRAFCQAIGTSFSGFVARFERALRNEAR